MDEIKNGDQVQLKSGGPIITVERIEPYGGVSTAWCQWFDDKKAIGNRFALTSLKAVD